MLPPLANRLQLQGFRGLDDASCLISILLVGAHRYLPETGRPDTTAAPLPQPLSLLLALPNIQNFLRLPAKHTRSGASFNIEVSRSWQTQGPPISDQLPVLYMTSSAWSNRLALLRYSHNNEAKNINCDLQLPGKQTDLYVLAHQLISEVEDLTNLRKHCTGDVPHLNDFMKYLIKCVTAQYHVVYL